MICLRSIPYGEEWVLVLQGSQHPFENSRSFQTFLLTMLEPIKHLQ